MDLFAVEVLLNQDLAFALLEFWFQCIFELRVLLVQFE
jgi:hypothetical protein